MEKEVKKSGFEKVLGTTDVLMVAFGAMIGWGWVVSSGNWIQTGGILGTALGFILGGIMIYFVGLCFAELTTAMPMCGGEQVFSYKAFGTVGSFVCTWSIILAYIGVVCYEAVSFPTIMQYLFPQIGTEGFLYEIAGFKIYTPWLVIAIVSAVFITVVNIVGTKKAAVLQNIFTLIIAGVGVLLLVGSLFNGDISNYEGQVIMGDSTGSIIENVVRIAIMTPFFFFGFDVIPQAAEEVNVPLKKLGRLMILSIVMAVGFYVMIVIGAGLVLSKAEVAKIMGDGGSALVPADAMAKAFGSEMMAKVLIVGGLCGIITSWNAFLIGGSRALYSMADANMIPKCFTKLTKKGKVPIVGLLLIGLLSIIAPFFGKVMLVWIVDASNFACCISYCVVSMAFIVLRSKEPNMERPYKVKNYKLVGAIAVVMSGAMALMYIIPGTSCTLIWQEWVITGGWILLGLLFALWGKKKYKKDFGVRNNI